MTSTGQDLPRPAKKKLRFALLVTALVVLLTPVCAVASLLCYMLFKPLNITPLARPFLPVVLQKDKAHPENKTTLDFGRIELRWNSLHDGFAIPLRLKIYNISLIPGAPTAPADTIKEAEATLSPLSLIHGQIRLHTLAVTGAHLNLSRTPDGDINLTGAPNSTHHHNKKHSHSFSFSSIRHVRLHDTVIKLDDNKTNTRWTLSPAEADLNVQTLHGKNAVTGSLSLQITSQDTPQTHLAINAGGVVTKNNNARWHIALTPVRPSAFASLAPELTQINNTVSLGADITLSPVKHSIWLVPGAVDLTTDIGAGTIEVKKLPYLLTHGTATLHADLLHHSASAVGAKLKLKELTLNLLNPAAPDQPDQGLTVTGQGYFDISDLLSPTGLSGGATLSIPGLQFAQIGNYWPIRAAKGGRLWVMKNITSGTARNLHVSLDLQSKTGWSALKVKHIDGGVDGTGLTVHWLRPVSPFHDVSAHLAINNLKSITITFTQGYQIATLKNAALATTGTGRITINSGTMVINGLDQKDQTSVINASMHGKVQDILSLLSEPRMHLLSRHPLSFSHPSGNADISLMLGLPLESHITADQLVVDARAALSHVHLENVVLHHSVNDGQFKLQATTKKLSLSGHALAGEQPSDVSYMMNFVPGSPTDIAETLHLNAHITPDSALAAGVVTGNHFEGMANLKVDYTRFFNKHAIVNLNLDLKHANIFIPMWHKAAGQPATLSATLNMADGHMVSVDKLAGDGPDLNIRGQINLRSQTAPRLVVSSFHIGRSSGHAELSLPFLSRDKTIDVSVVASQLDLSPLLDSAFASAPSSSPDTKKKENDGYSIPTAANGKLHGPPGNAWRINLQADSLIYNETKPALHSINARFFHNGLRLEKMLFTMKAPSPITIQMTPAPKNRHLSVNIPDAGGFLKAFNIIPDVEGGHATLEGTFNDALPAAPFDGVINVSTFSVTKVPGIVLAARNISLYGWINSKKASSFAITHLSVPVSLSDGIINIHDANAGNGALGATMKGDINLKQGTLDIDGTVVPLFALNSLLGKIPAIGQLFSPEKNGGLLAVTFSLSGKLKNPDFHVNPYAILLPGALRAVLPD